MMKAQNLLDMIFCSFLFRFTVITLFVAYSLVSLPFVQGARVQFSEGAPGFQTALPR